MPPQSVVESPGADLRNADEAAQDSSVVSDEQGDFIVMCTSDFDGELPLFDAEKASLLAGYDDYLNGRVVEARELIANMRSRRGLQGDSRQGCVR